MDIVKKIEELGIVPVVKLDRADDAVPLAKALAKGGLPLAEITFRTDAAEESIRRIAGEVPEVLVGAGTVLTVEQVDRALGAGAAFIVSPGINPGVVRHCIDREVPVFPGVATPSDIEVALELGLRVLKFFPAEALGGLDTLKALSGPYGQVRFMPLGGVNPENMNKYLGFPKVAAVGGTWLAKDDVVKAGDFAKITSLAAEAINIMLGFELAHLGINASDADASIGAAKTFSSVFNFPLKEGNSSNFAGKGIEVNKSKGLGANGHIAISTNSISRAAAWLEGKGIKVNHETAKKDAKGGLVAVYLRDEIAGFAIHLLQKK